LNFLKTGLILLVHVRTSRHYQLPSTSITNEYINRL
jgi:hypothetical protein